MTTPVLLVVDDEGDRLDAVCAALNHRYEKDYRIAGETSVPAALRHLSELQDRGTQVAIVMAAAFMTAADDSEVLAQARSLHPSAKRVLLVPRGGPKEPSMRVPAFLLQDRAIAEPVLRAMALGVVDSYLPAPASPSDEGFHRGITELLEEWAHTVMPDRPAARIFGDEGSRRSHELRDLFGRNSIPYLFHGIDTPESTRWLSDAGRDRSVLPVVLLYNGGVLVDPANDEIAAAFGLSSLPTVTIDVAIIGAGPAGLSAAVYTASEGLSTLLLEREAIGGQAGSSSLIRNYLGFPRGISGANLATRAFEQAWSFGAIPSVAGPVARLERTASGYVLDLANSARVSARTVIIATGVSYRRLDAPGIDQHTGNGVFYGAIASESSFFGGQHVFIAGAANSAGQAAVNVARHAKEVTILARGESLAARMSHYLIEQIRATSNICVRTSTEVVAATGDGKLESLTLGNTTTGVTETVPASALLVLIGAMPHTEWIPDGIQRDKHGFIVTGDELSNERLPLETSMAGVFAAGDVRSGSVKRVASAVGEGSIAGSLVVQCLHSSRQELRGVRT